MTKLLDVDQLTVSFVARNKKLLAVRDIHFDLFSGETIGIVGESGCGKSVAMQSLVRLIPSPPSLIEEGCVLFNGQDLLRLTPRELRMVRGRGISFIFQDPMTALNPTMTIGDQIVEPMIYHRTVPSKQNAKERAMELLRLVQIADGEQRFFHFPHQLSGGMRQRVLIAMALAAQPRILIADEPTTALDPTIRSGILTLLKQLQRELSISLILISHDIGAIARLCDRLFVMYAGEIIESGPAQELLSTPKHPYLRLLLRSLPTLHSPSRTLLSAIEGFPPNLFAPPAGCSFASRCPMATHTCQQSKPLPCLQGKHMVSCQLYAANSCLY